MDDTEPRAEERTLKTATMALGWALAMTQACATVHPQPLVLPPRSAPVEHRVAAYRSHAAMPHLAFSGWAMHLGEGPVAPLNEVRPFLANSPEAEEILHERDNQMALAWGLTGVGLALILSSLVAIPLGIDRDDPSGVTTVPARERHQPVVAAARAARTHEPAREHAAAHEGLELRDDVARQRASALLHLLGEGREVLPHEGMHHPVAHGVAGAHVRMSTAVGHRGEEPQSDERAIADRMVLPRDHGAPRRRPGSSWQRSRDGVLLIIGVPVTGADPCQRGCRVGSPIPRVSGDVDFLCTCAAFVLTMPDARSTLPPR